MRNIYDIMAEQRSFIDTKMASHDLDYTINYFTGNQDVYFVQEGLGEGIKNAATKVIEFIRAVINKIKELFRKIIDFFSKRRSGKERFKETMNNISDKKSGGGGSSNNTNSASNKNDKSDDQEKPSNNAKSDDQEKPSNNAKSDDQEKPSKEDGGGGNQYYKFKNGSAPQSIRMHVQNSLRTVSIIKFASLDIKSKVSDTFFNTILSVSGNLVANYDNASDKLFMKNIKKNLFKGEGSFKNMPEASIADRIRAEIKEPTEPETIKVADLDELIEEYVYIGTDTIDRNLKGWHDTAIKNLNGLEEKMKKIQNEGNDRTNDISNIKQVTAMVSNFMNFMPMNILNAYNTLDKIFNQINSDAEAAYGN